MMKLIQYWQFNASAQQCFIEDLSALVKDGVPVSQAVDTIAKIVDGVPRQVALQINIALSSGQHIADGMQGYFFPAVIEIIRAGEEGGALSQALAAAVSLYQARVGAWNTVIQSMLYPLVVVVVALVMIVVIKTSVLENFASIKAVELWPVTGQELYHFASLLQNWWWAMVILLLAAITGIVYALQNLTGSLRQGLDQWPLLSLYRQSVAARFMETLGLLITNGVALKKALSIMHRNAAPYMSWHLMLMEYRLAGGKENIAEVVDTQLILKADMYRLKVIATGKGFDHALVSLGRQALVRYAAAISRAGKIAGALLLLVAAILAVTMVLGIYTVGSMIAA